MSTAALATSAIFGMRLSMVFSAMRASNTSRDTPASRACSAIAADTPGASGEPAGTQRHHANTVAAEIHGELPAQAFDRGAGDSEPAAAGVGFARHLCGERENHAGVLLRHVTAPRPSR